MQLIAWVWSSVLRFVADHRAMVLALLTVLGAYASNVATTSHAAASAVQPTSTDLLTPIAFIAFLVTVGGIVFAGAVPAEYEAVRRLEYLLPVLFHVLELADGDRATIHRLRRWPTKGYDQLTEYYPPSVKKRARGRHFSMSHGIVAQCFTTHEPQRWSVPNGVSLQDALKERWSFTDDEVARLTPDRKSFLAFPIARRGNYARAVLYIDSPDAGRLSGPRGDTIESTLRDVFERQLEQSLE